jgi:hypothetical protein
MTPPGGPTRRRREARTSAPEATLRQSARPILLLYRCPLPAAWLTVNACTALRARQDAGAEAKSPPRACSSREHE